MSFRDEDLERLVPRLTRYAVHLTRHRADADDLLQATVERALAKRHLFRQGTSLSSWMTMMMRNVFISRRRQEATRDHYIEQWASEQPPCQIGAGQEHAVHLRETLSDIADLPRRERHALQLVAIEDNSHDSAARKAGVAEGTMKSRLSRARQGLRVAQAA